MSRRLGTALLAAVTASIAVAAPAQAATTITKLAGLPGATSNSAYAIDIGGVVVGRSGSGQRSRAVKWDRNGVAKDLGGPADWTNVRATAINRTGVAAGSGSGASGTNRAIRFNLNGTHTVLDLVPGFSDAFAEGIDDTGGVFGEGWDRSTGNRLAVRWDANGVRTTLALPQGYTKSLLNDASVNGFATGYVFEPGLPDRAVRWNPDGTVTVLAVMPDGGDSAGSSVNRYGDVVGAAISVTGRQFAVRWNRDGSVTDLGAATHLNSYARAINDNGVAIGTAQNSEGGFRPVRWSRTGEMTDLGSPAGAYESWPWAINYLGVMVGFTDRSDPQAAVKWVVS